MTLIVCCFVPTGIVLSGDSRTTGLRTVQVPRPTATNPDSTIDVQSPWILSDAARKVFSLKSKYVVGTWGAAFVNDMPIAHYVSELELSMDEHAAASTEAVATALLTFFRTLDQSLETGFFIGGYDGPTPSVFSLWVQGNTKTRINVDPQGTPTYSVYYGGDIDIVTRLLSKPEQFPPFNLLNLQDAVDLSRHLIRTTIDQMRFEPRFPSVGGDIDSITATPNRTKFLTRKELHG